jgi:hypothetical protein
MTDRAARAAFVWVLVCVGAAWSCTTLQPAHASGGVKAEVCQDWADLARFIADNRATTPLVQVKLAIHKMVLDYPRIFKDPDDLTYALGIADSIYGPSYKDTPPADIEAEMLDACRANPPESAQ